MCLHAPCPSANFRSPPATGKLLVNPRRLSSVLHFGPNAPVSRKQCQLQRPLLLLPLVMPVHASRISRKRTLHRENQPTLRANLLNHFFGAPRSASRGTAKSISLMTGRRILPVARKVNGGICAGAAALAESAAWAHSQGDASGSSTSERVFPPTHAIPPANLPNRQARSKKLSSNCARPRAKAIPSCPESLSSPWSILDRTAP